MAIFLVVEDGLSWIGVNLTSSRACLRLLAIVWDVIGISDVPL